MATGSSSSKSSFSQLQIDTDKIIRWNEKEFVNIQDEYYENLKRYDEYEYERDLIEGYNVTLDDLNDNMEKTLASLERIEQRISNDIWTETGQEFPVYSDIDLMRGVATRTSFKPGARPGFLVTYEDGKMVLEKEYFE